MRLPRFYSKVIFSGVACPQTPQAMRMAMHALYATETMFSGTSACVLTMDLEHYKSITKQTVPVSFQSMTVDPAHHSRLLVSVSIADLLHKHYTVINFLFTCHTSLLYITYTC